MPIPPSFHVLILALILVSVWIYANLLGRVLIRGGEVSVREFGMPDLFLGSFFAAWFGATIARSLHAPERVVTNAGVIEGALLFLFIMFVIAGFLRYRGIHVLRQFGIMRLFAPKAVALGAGFLLAAYPLIGLIGQLTERELGDKAHPQDVVKFFLEAAEKSDRTSIVLTLLLGVLVAPVAEEFLFRGYLYGVMKRYCGPLAAMLLSSGLFAAVHLNLAAFPALFVLAMCLVLAYETTGSILVNMSMHALFNLTMLTLMLHLPHPPP